MTHYRPLMLQELDVRVPGLDVQRLRLNRHLPEVDLVAEHAHPFAQILCYLSGRGSMKMAGSYFEVGPGAVIFLPPKCLHAFRETAGRRPLCLVLDVSWRGPWKQTFCLGRLGQSEAGLIKKQLSELTRLPDALAEESRLIVAAGVLRIVDVALRGLGILPARRGDQPSFVRQFDRLLREGEIPVPGIGDLSSRIGYQTDYLNRIFKQATGQTLREYRDAFLVERAKRLLRENERIAATCEALGFLDQSYFSRWFKKNTGLQPRAYAAAPTTV